MPITASEIKQKFIGVITLFIIFTIIGSLIIFAQPQTPDLTAYEAQLHEIFEDAKIQFEHIRGVTLPSTITLSIYTKQQAIDRWGKEPQNFDTDSIRRQENVYKSLFLMDENESLRDALSDWITSWTAVTVGNEIYVIYENFWPWDMPNAEAILIHELTHVWQNTLPLPTSYDNDNAQKALMEGDASYMADYYKTQYNNNNNNHTGYSYKNTNYQPQHTAKMSSLLYISQLNSVYPNIPDTITNLNLFPYIQGKIFVSTILDNYDGDWSRLNQCYIPPYTPRATTQILHPNKYFTYETHKNTITFYPSIDDNWTIMPSHYGYSSNTYGEYFIYVMLTHWLNDDNQAQKTSAGWTGDTFTYYEKDNNFLLVWNITWNSIQYASEFSQAFTNMMNLTQANQQNNTQWNTNNRQFVLTWNPNTATTMLTCYYTANYSNLTFYSLWCIVLGDVKLMEPIPVRVRETIVKHKQAGKSGQEIAQWLMIHKQTVSRVWQQHLTTGNVTPKPKNSGRKPKITPEIMEKILLKIEQQPDITINGLIDEFNLQISEAALSKRLKKAGLTYKKRLSIQKTKNDPT